MFQLVLGYVIQADREREIEAAIRRRRLLEPPDSATEPASTSFRRAIDGRTLPTRARTIRG